MLASDADSESIREQAGFPALCLRMSPNSTEPGSSFTRSDTMTVKHTSRRSWAIQPIDAIGCPSGAKRARSLSELSVALPRAAADLDLVDFLDEHSSQRPVVSLVAHCSWHLFNAPPAGFQGCLRYPVCSWCVSALSHARFSISAALRSCRANSHFTFFHSSAFVY